MQFLRQQRKNRKRKSFLEKIGLNGQIKSVAQFYADYMVLDQLQDGGQGTIHSIARRKNMEEKKHEDEEGNETKNDVHLVAKTIFLSDIDDIEQELIAAVDQYELLCKKRLLNHYGIYYDEQKKELLIVTERLDINLSEYDNKDDLNEQELKQIMCDILDTMNNLHLSGYIHCDINPFNVMRDMNGKWKLIDYDMMMKIDSKRGYVKDCWKGTIGWVASEIGSDIDSSNNKYSFATDIWSFGLCLLYLLNGLKNPFDLTKDEVLKYDLNDESAKLEYYYKHKMTMDTYRDMQHLLITWFASDKISFNLYDLLLNHLLVFDVNDRCESCKDIMKHQWFESYIKQNMNRYESLNIGTEEEGEIGCY